MIAASPPRRWQHSLFWLMFGADLVLVGVTAIAFPGATGGRLILMMIVLLIASFILNLVLTPADLRPSSIALPDGGGARANADGEGALRLLQHVLATQEDERARLARELRELVAQPLVGIGFQLAAAAGGTAVGADFETARESVREAAEEIAAIADELYPGLMGELGLVAALESLRRRVMRRSSLPCELAVDGEPFMLPLSLTRAFYRFAEETLENTERHAKARSVTVRLRFAHPTVSLEISDDGQGFQSDQPAAISARVGLRLARELLAGEGATMQIDSVPGRGTRATATATLSSEGPS